MRDCWRHDPRERPSFTVIKTRLEEMLNEDALQPNVVYIDQMKENFYEILENLPGEKC